MPLRPPGGPSRQTIGSAGPSVHACCQLNPPPPSPIEHVREILTFKSCAISRTRRWKGSSVDFWYRRMSRRATVPGRNRFFTLPTGYIAWHISCCMKGSRRRTAWTVFLAPVDLVATCLRGGLPVHASDCP